MGMPGYRPEAIVNEFLRRRTDTAWPQQMYIQKLAYMAHGWNLAINNEPLTSHPPEAWDNGPVYREVWDHIKELGYRGPNYTLVDPLTDEPFTAPLTPSESAVVEHVWKKYGNKSAKELSRMTHEPDTPWFKAYLEGRNMPLVDEEIRKHYVELAMAGRDQRAKTED